MTRTVSLPLEDWPDADRAMWVCLTKVADPFDDDGALSHLRATSQQALVKHYGRWLEWLFRSEPGALEEPPERRATSERLASWIASLDHVAPPTLHTIVFGALRVLKAAAPRQDWTAQDRAANRLNRLARRSLSNRKAGRVLSSAVLFDAALELVGPKAARANTPLNAALMRRDGTMMAFFALMPLRLRSMSELTLGVSVELAPSRIMIRLSRDMTKNGQEWEAPVPDLLEPTLRAYLEAVRPWLMRRSVGQHQALWVGRMGSPLGSVGIAQAISKATREQIGVAISPHLFRDMAATTLVRSSPTETRAVRALLGHKSYATTERHYVHAEGIEAGRDHARLLEVLRRERE